MSSIGWTVSEDSFTDTTPLGVKRFVNMIAVYNPAVHRRLTLACHYDSKLFTDFEFIGATDSAVPCALMIDIARLLTASLAKVMCCYSLVTSASNVMLTSAFVCLRVC